MLLRVNILDYPSGVCIFQKLWRWKGDDNLSIVCKVIVAFFKLSKSLGDKGDATYALFDPPPPALTKPDLKWFAPKRERPKPVIRCMFAKEDHVIVAVFHDQRGDFAMVQKLIQAILRLFMDNFRADAAGFRQVFDDMVDEKMCKRLTITQEDLLEKFKGFDGMLEKLEEREAFERWIREQRLERAYQSGGTASFDSRDMSLLLNDPRYKNASFEEENNSSNNSPNNSSNNVLNGSNSNGTPSSSSASASSSSTSASQQHQREQTAENKTETNNTTSIRTSTDKAGEKEKEKQETANGTVKSEKESLPASQLEEKEEDAKKTEEESEKRKKEEKKERRKSKDDKKEKRKSIKNEKKEESKLNKEERRKERKDSKKEKKDKRKGDESGKHSRKKYLVDSMKKKGKAAKDFIVASEEKDDDEERDGKEHHHKKRKGTAH
ncbi:transcription initiation factor TFIID subunit 3 isoform X1 [Balamuthia mandrillaris]